ncbi:MAG: hypothetical protein KC503_33910 [Myxococcales bacterium]|nr:hypothetical protein [Myxococcales bacterium]
MTGLTPARVVLAHRHGKTIDAALVQTVQSSMELRELATGQVVPASVVIAGAGGPRVTLTVTPASALAAKWYELRVRSVDGTRLDVARANAGVVGGDLVSRFHPANAPVLQAITVCDKKAGVKTVTLSFSERVTANTLASDSVRITHAGRTQGCQGYGDLKAGLRVMSFICQASDLAQQVDVELAASFRSVDGPILTGIDTALRPKHTFDVSALAQSGPCRIYTPHPIATR